MTSTSQLRGTCLLGVAATLTNFTRNYSFNQGEGQEENAIITATGQYVIAWDFAKVKKGHLDKYEIKKYEDMVVQDNFKFGDDKQIVSVLESMKPRRTHVDHCRSWPCRTMSSRLTRRTSNGPREIRLRPLCPVFRVGQASWIVRTRRCFLRWDCCGSCMYCGLYT
jgi:hypothetical protein